MIYGFGNCELDAGVHELRVGGDVRTVEPQVFDLLLYLVENRDRMVTKDELFEHVWEGRIVSEANLSNRIGLARQALGDDGKVQALIKTFPRRGFRFVGEVAERGAASAAQVNETPVKNRDRSDKPSIAVLPFENLSGDPDQEYFSDGITEDIITALSHVRNFFVTARSSTFTYKGRAADVRTVAEDLGVRYVLEGSVRKSGERLRVSAQLIDGETGNHLWAEKFDRDLKDIFAVQDEITQTVVGALQPEITRSEIDRARRKPPESLDAWDLYQRGLWHQYRMNNEDNAAAIELFTRAIELDPKFVHPYAGLVQCYAFERTMHHAERNVEDVFAPARKAVEIDPEDARAHLALGMAHFINRDHLAAIAEHKTAIQLNPSAGQCYGWLGFAQALSDSPEEALESFRSAINLSPRDPMTAWFHNGMGAALFNLQRHEECVEWVRKAVQLPNDPWLIRAYLVSALAHLERDEEASKALTDLLELQPDCTISLVQRLVLTTVDSYREHLFDGLRKAGMPEG